MRNRHNEKHSFPSATPKEKPCVIACLSCIKVQHLFISTDGVKIIIMIFKKKNIATSPVFHVLLTIMRSDFRCPIEEPSFLPLKRHVTQRGKSAIGRRDRRNTNKGGEEFVEYMAEFNGDVTYFSLTLPSEDFWWSNPFFTLDLSSTFPFFPSKGQAGCTYITINCLTEAQSNHFAKGASQGMEELTHSNRCSS